MELQGKVIAVLDERTGTSARGEWKARDFVIETHEAYPHKMVFTVFGADRLARFNIQMGQEVMVSFDIDAHEYNNRWFNSIRAFDVRQVDPAQFGVQSAAAPQPMPSASSASAFSQQNGASASTPETFSAAQDTASEESADDLPF